ncbi:unnamed protein product [Pseudo-nitzschia multistriata]|uniref:Uncharacterized protein n=1 Tax=Pseudo-nitzschia multistriata TaxID=183589 RepID=A0A448ZM35_9STRA|nr:unnamed protein product [Pseudo-nitzschia multistriata]
MDVGGCDSGCDGHRHEHGPAAAAESTPDPRASLPSAQRKTKILLPEGPQSASEPEPQQPHSFLESGPGSGPQLDGALYGILEYLAPRDFYKLGALVGSRFWRDLLFEDPRTEYLFCDRGRTYLKNVVGFRWAVLSADPDPLSVWKPRLLSVRLSDSESDSDGIGRQQQQRAVLPTGGIRSPNRERRIRYPLNRQPIQERQEQQQQQHLVLNRMGILSGPEEEASVTDDTTGYFGIRFLRPGVLAVWGDYSGIFVTPDADRILDPNRFSRPLSLGESGGEHHNRRTGHAARDAGYLFPDDHQVVAVHFGTPYVFLGFALGKIQSIDSRPVGGTPCEASTGYPHTGESLSHAEAGGEVSCLCPVEGGRHLASASVARDRNHQGRRAGLPGVLVHWGALEDGNLDRASSVLPQGGIDRPPVLAMASSSIRFAGGSETESESETVILSIARRDRVLDHVCLWEAGGERAGPAAKRTETTPPFFEPLVGAAVRAEAEHALRVPEFLTRRRIRGDRQQFVYLRYFEKTRLVVGTSWGALVRIDAGAAGGESGTRPRVLSDCCRGGMVEAVELVGHSRPNAMHAPVMVTAGGSDGRVRFWDWETLALLGTLRIHPGINMGLPVGRNAGRYASPGSRSCPVVSVFFCHQRSSLVALCRDGHVREWGIEEPRAGSASELPRGNENTAPGSPRRRNPRRTAPESPRRRNPRRRVRGSPE